MPINTQASIWPQRLGARLTSAVTAMHVKDTARDSFWHEVAAGSRR
jgi:hypothetical protein